MRASPRRPLGHQDGLAEPGHAARKHHLDDGGHEQRIGCEYGRKDLRSDAFGQYVRVGFHDAGHLGGAIFNCDIGNRAFGASVTITLVTTPSTTGTVTNTVTVVGNRPETNTSNNTASSSVQVVSNATPPTVFCRHGKAVKGVRVRIKGPKLDVRTKPSTAKGVIKRVVTIRKAGVVLFTPIASRRCNTKRVGVTGVFTPPVTG